jgi:hypothetical protein
MTLSNSDWRGQDWQDDKPMWDREHPIFARVKAVTESVLTEHAETVITVPDLDDDLRGVVATFATMFTGKFAKAQRLSAYVALEAVALLYCNIGGTRETWLAYLDKLGIKIAPQSGNIFVSFLRLICGSAPDTSRRIGKMAQALAAWASIYRPGPATLGDDPDSEDWGWPDPAHWADAIGDAILGSSDFVKWLKDHEGGYSDVAARWAKAQADGNVFQPRSKPPPPPAEPGKASQDGSPPPPFTVSTRPWPAAETKPEPLTPEPKPEPTDLEGTNEQKRREAAEQYDKGFRGMDAHLRQKPTPGPGMKWCPGCHKVAIDEDLDCCAACIEKELTDIHQAEQDARTLCKKLGMTEEVIADPAVRYAIQILGDEAAVLKSFIADFDGETLGIALCAFAAVSDSTVADLTDFLCQRCYGETCDQMIESAEALDEANKKLEKEIERLASENARLRDELAGRLVLLPPETP